MADRPAMDDAPAAPAPVRVLAVDDSPANLMVLASFLRHASVEVRAVESSAAALIAYQVFKPNLVFMDLSMPEIDGFEAAANIRQHEAAFGLDRVPIIALTAYEIDSELGKRIAVSMDDHLSKPVRKQDVVRMLQLWVGTQPALST
jgi:CheY-like chemotaxis protein